MSVAPPHSAATPRVVFDMTFPDRNRGGSGVYARSLVGALRSRGDLDVAEIRSERPGVLNTVSWLARGADRQVRSTGADLLHCPNFVAPWKVHTPYVVTIFDLSTRRFAGDHPLEWRAYERWLFPARARAAARVIAISELTRQDAIREYGLSPERILTIHPGVDGRFFEAGETGRPGDGSQPRLLFPGAPVARKNVDLVLRALSRAASGSTMSRACLQISGATADRFPEVASRIASLGLEGRVDWLGVVPVDRMPAVMRAADVCVYPSLYEGFGFPPLEAMASGTPVVASNASCLPEVLDGAAALVDASDVRGFAEAVEAVLGKPDVRARLVEAGRRRAARFTWARCAEQTAAVYRDVLAEAA